MKKQLTQEEETRKTDLINMLNTVKEKQSKMETEKRELRQFLAELCCPYKIGERVWCEGIYKEPNKEFEVRVIHPGHIWDDYYELRGAPIKKDGIPSLQVRRLYSVIGLVEAKGEKDV